MYTVIVQGFYLNITISKLYITNRRRGISNLGLEPPKMDMFRNLKCIKNLQILQCGVIGNTVLWLCKSLEKTINYF